MFGLIKLIRFIVGLISIVVPILSQIIIRVIWSKYDEMKASLPLEAQNRVPYPWIIWVLWTLFGIGLATRLPGIFLKFYTYSLMAKTYKDFYLENYLEIIQ